MLEKLQLDICLKDFNLHCEQTTGTAISEKILTNKSMFHEYLSRITQQFDFKADVKMDTLKVEDVLLLNNSGVAKIGFAWDAFHDFEDIEKSNQLFERLPFTIEGTKAIFNLEMPQMHLVHEI